jgi:hypothetical protein
MWLGLCIALAGWFIMRGIDSAGYNIRKGLKELGEGLNDGF